MDQSNNSDDQFSVYSTQNAKPNNRKVFTHKGLCIRSDFPGGNINQASFQQQFRIEGKAALVIQFWGNSDAQCDLNDKSWFFFSVSGIKDNQNIKYQQIIFRFKNANTYRKFVKQRKFRPYIVYREEFQKIKTEWKTIYISKMNILQDQMIQAQFVYKIQPGIDKAYFSLHLPYSMSDLQKLNENILDFMDSLRQNTVYYHREIIAYSVDLFPIYMFTITSINNIMSSSQRQATLWPNIKGNRPFLLKNKPEIVLTARVHPAQTASSFCVQGIVQNLIKNKSFDLLRQIFIFRIVPIINPDGVQNGHYRLDNYLQNLNRFYGHSSPNKTPSIFAVEKLLIYLREKSKLFLFMDIHGHNSPKPSFIFGNYNQNFFQSVQNKTFVKVMQSLSEGNFSSNECEFSKKNMSLKQKYDEHSKQASARVFAYRGTSQCNNLGLPKTQVIVEHSYTLEVHPYIVFNNLKGFMKSENSYRSLPITPAPKRVQNIPLIMDLTKLQICEQYKKVGENVLISILQLVGANIYTYSQEVETYYLHRRRALREMAKFPQFYDRLKRSKQKEINKELLDRYFNKWSILQSYRQYLTKNPDILQKFRSKSLFCPLFQIYDEHNYKKLKKQESGLKNSSTFGRNEQKMQQKIDTIIHEQASQHLSEEQRREKYEFEKQFSKRKCSELKDERKKSVLKSMEFEVLEKIEIQNKKERQNQIINACSIKSCSPSLNPESNGTKNQYGYLDRKLKKLIFRHKTEMQKQYYHKNSKKDKLPFLYEIQFTDLQNQFLRNEKLKELQNQYFKISSNKKDASLKKNNCKSAYDHGIQESNSRIDQINEKIALNWKNFRNSTEHEQLKKFEKMNPRIQHLVKRISANKQESRPEEEKNSMNKIQMHRIKSTKTMVSNLLISKSKKKNQTLESQKQYAAYSPKSNPKQICYDNKSVLIPMIHQTKTYDKILDSSQNMELVGYEFPQCLVSLETKRDIEKQGIKSHRKQTNNKLLSFLQRSKNNYNTKFIQRAKQILCQKSKVYGNAQK